MLEAVYQEHSSQSTKTIKNNDSIAHSYDSGAASAFTPNQIKMLRAWHLHGPKSKKTVQHWIDLGTPINARGLEHMPAATYFKVYRPENPLDVAERERQFYEARRKAYVEETKALIQDLPVLLREQIENGLRTKGPRSAREEIQRFKSIIPLAERTETLASRLPKEHAWALTKRFSELAFDVHQPSIIDALLSEVEKIDDPTTPAIDADFADFQDFATEQTKIYDRRFATWKQLTAADAASAEKALYVDIMAVEKRLGWKKPGDMTPEAFYARARDTRFWIRNAQKKVTRSSIQIARILQMLGKGRGRAEYLPVDVVRRRHQQIDFLQDWMQRTILTSSDGRQTTLAKVTEGAASRQLAELDIRAIAQYEIAKRRGWGAYILTVTTPSRFHASSTRGPKGKQWSVPNPAFNPSLTANDSVAWLQDKWVKFRALAQKICGPGGWDSFGALEGHTDATGHRHIIIYCPHSVVSQLTDAAYKAFLFSDNPNEPGARKHRVQWETIRSEGGAKKYITEILRYTTKTLEDSENPSAEALYAKAIGRRSFSLSQDKVSIWRWLRSRKHPYGLPAELTPAWAAAHGLTVDEIPSVKEFEEGQHDKYKNGINGAVTRPEHYVAFLDSVATQYKDAWRESDYYHVVDKTLDDFRIETADRETGEVDDEAAFDAMLNAWHAAWRGDDSLIVKSKTRILNSYGEPKKPSGGAAKSPMLYREDMFGNIIIASRQKIFWTKETTPKDRSTSNKIVEISSEKERQLQLSIQSQGGAERAAQGLAPTSTVDLNTLHAWQMVRVKRGAFSCQRKIPAHLLEPIPIAA